MMLHEPAGPPRPGRGAGAGLLLEAIERTERKVEDVRRAMPAVEDAIKALEAVGVQHEQFSEQLRDLHETIEGLNLRLGTVETVLRGVDGAQREVSQQIDGRLDTLKRDLAIYFAVVGSIAGLIVIITMIHVL